MHRKEVNTMSNKYLWNTDELINEEDLEFPDRDKERSRRRYKKGLTIAKRRKEVADRNGIKRWLTQIC